jgi:hypothetical protein
VVSSPSWRDTCPSAPFASSRKASEFTGRRSTRTSRCRRPPAHGEATVGAEAVDLAPGQRPHHARRWGKGQFLRRHPGRERDDPLDVAAFGDDRVPGHGGKQQRFLQLLGAVVVGELLDERPGVIDEHVGHFGPGRKERRRAGERSPEAQRLAPLLPLAPFHLQLPLSRPWALHEPTLHEGSDSARTRSAPAGRRTGQRGAAHDTRRQDSPATRWRGPSPGGGPRS